MGEGTAYEQKDALAAIGGALVIVQMAERMIKHCMVYVLPPGGNLSLEKLESLKADEAHRTLGHFLRQLRQQVEIHPTFDERLKEFLTLRNQLAHNLSEVSGLGFECPDEIVVTVEWAGRLSSLALQVHNVFLALTRAWQEQNGMRDNFPGHKFFQEIDMQFKPLLNHLFMEKPPKDETRKS